MARRIEQGNVLGFVLVGAVLVALLLGGIYLVRQNMAGQSGDTEVVTIDDQANDSGDGTVVDDSTDTTTADDQPTNAGNEGVSEDESLKDALNDTTDADANSDDAASDNEGDETGTLPETGPADTAFTIMGATLLAGASFAYVQSRRHL